MDNFDLVNFDEGGGLPPSGSDEETPIPFDDSDSMPAPASGPAPASVSRKPLDLGAGKPSAAPAAQPVRTPPKPAVKPVPKPVAVSSAPRPAKAGAPVEAGHERITGVKTFFAKLHHSHERHFNLRHLLPHLAVACRRLHLTDLCLRYSLVCVDTGLH